ncbi:hypothetical protein TBLA_0J00330 [Henningerozyma blattae CBS 6284]|uniref:triacylglycerol lipase n=1 Tax=Henningerozyma blattae (strain ATCC 34711 / CBS 6284 / DSM 70876 / NBRC 10599 / NRRL Y-10934 / UCD 77-7) TaxID=1071380 RepID=I2H9I1_HENB6|nr:hypothetical protein TBLA_0J00330 [Tetrapisispora blattae CBS 6284]CCH63033.1 hypothetical protein TBLA_0J00330 [Tetrapisispora blattae CBS 6284]
MNFLRLLTPLGLFLLLMYGILSRMVSEEEYALQISENSYNLESYEDDVNNNIYPTEILQDNELEPKHYIPPDFYISDYDYAKLVYFSKCCGLSNCIGEHGLREGLSLNEGACPSYINFCYDENVNPTVSRTRIELIMEADKGELGTGYVMVDHGRKVIVIAFRGSSTRQDWYSDFEIYPTRYVPGSMSEYIDLIRSGKIRPCKGCKMHRGFYRFKQSLGKHFLRKVEKIFAIYSDYNLVVTGHSLGAAIASMLGIELKLKGYNPLVLTYATPKMFNKEMKEWVNELFNIKKIHDKNLKRNRLDLKGGYYRVIHTGDYIPMLPPKFEEAGLEIFIKKLELPHLVGDLEYRGIEKTIIDGRLPGYAATNANKWLHTDEHRSYFISIQGCKNF